MARFNSSQGARRMAALMSSLFGKHFIALSVQTRSPMGSLTTSSILLTALSTSWNGVDSNVKIEHQGKPTLNPMRITKSCVPSNWRAANAQVSGRATYVNSFSEIMLQKERGLGTGRTFEASFSHVVSPHKSALRLFLTGQLQEMPYTLYSRIREAR
jgi:hypothetical protein